MLSRVGVLIIIASIFVWAELTPEPHELAQRARAVAAEFATAVVHSRAGGGPSLISISASSVWAVPSASTPRSFGSALFPNSVGQLRLLPLVMRGTFSTPVRMQRI